MEHQLMHKDRMPGSGKSASKIRSHSSGADRHDQVFPIPLDKCISAGVEPRGEVFLEEVTFDWEWAG